MPSPAILLGILLLIVGCVLAFVAWNSEDRLFAIRAAPTTSAQDIYARYRHEGGAFGQVCEISGVVECDASLNGPLTQQPCVIYSHIVRWDEYGPPPAWSRRSGGLDNMVRTGGSTDLNDRHVPYFWVRDGSGRVRVDPLMAEFDLKLIDERYEVMSGSIGTSERRTWYTEKALPLGHQVYVLGYMGQKDGEPIVGRHPSDRNKRFIISYRSEQELLRATGLRTNLLYIGAAISAIGGLAALMWHFMR